MDFFTEYFRITYFTTKFEPKATEFSSEFILWRRWCKNPFAALGNLLDNFSHLQIQLNGREICCQHNGFMKQMPVQSLFKGGLLMEPLKFR